MGTVGSPSIGLLVAICTLAGTWLLTCSQVASSVPADGAPPGETLAEATWLHGRDFVVNYKVKIPSPEGLGSFDVTEFYSNVKRKARLIIKRAEGPGDLRKTLEYYYTDGYLLRRVHMNDNKTPVECMSSNFDKLLKDFNLPANYISPTWNVESQRLPSYLIGFTRFLWLVEANKDRMTSFRESFIKDNTVLGHFQFNINEEVKDQAAAEISVYMSGGSMDGQNAPNGELPVSVWVEAVSGTVIMKISGYRLLNHDEISAIEDPINYLLLPLGAGCNERLPKFAPGGLSMPRVASFRATVDRVGQSDESADAIFVAYDGYLGFARRDYLIYGGFNGDHYAIQLHDLNRGFKLKVRYNMLDESKVDEDLLTSGHGSECLASRSKAKPIEFEPLIPLSSLALMGETFVRGIECAVLEMQTDQLPAMIFPRLGYRDANYQEISGYDPNKNLSSSVYSVVYYIALGSQEEGQKSDLGVRVGDQLLGPLIRVDVLKEGQLEYRVDIEGFRWQLSQAPNGDHPDELFSIGDKCWPSTPSVSQADLNMANLHMNLRYAIDPETANQLSVDEVAKLAGQPSVRNRAFRRSLVANAGISANQIDHLESRISGRGETLLMIALSAKLNASPIRADKFYQPVSVGYGAPMTHLSFPRSQNFEACFWDAVARRNRLQQSGKGLNLLFSYCDNFCTFDEDPTMETNTEGRLAVAKSRVYLMLQSYTCQIFKLEALGPDPSTLSPWGTVLEQLKFKPLRVPLISNLKTQELSLWVKSVDLDVYSVDGRDSHRELHGLALARGDPKIVLVESKIDEPPVSLSQCKAHCLSSTSCRSYSYCSYLDKPECLESSRNFKDSATLQAIATAKVANKGRLAPIRLELTDSKIELRADPRCRIYNKRQIEMFKPVEYEPVSYESRFMSLIPVDDEEECAEFCMGINMKLFANSTIHLSSPNAIHSIKGSENFMLDLKKAQIERLRTSWCGQFYYADLTIANTLPNSIVKKIGPKKLANKNGLCAVPRQSVGKLRPAGNKTTKREDPLKNLIVKRYEFMYLSLFDPMAGFKMKYFSNDNDFSDTDMSYAPSDIMRSIDRSNRQLMLVGRSPEECARDCFLQNMKLEPWCRSFDYATYNSLAKTQNSPELGSVHSYCMLNTNTLKIAKDSINSEYLVSKVAGGVLVRHYEPHNSFENQQLVVSAPSMEDLDPSLGIYRQLMPRAGLLFFMFLSLLSGLALGAVLSVCLGRRIESSQREEDDQDFDMRHVRLEQEAD